MWKIGNIAINSHVVLAPMAGITSVYYRNFLKPFGIGYSVTEMVSANAIVAENKKVFELLKTSKNDKPIAIQLFSNNADIMEKAIKKLNDVFKIDYDILDINLACPVKKIVNNKSGVYWMHDINAMLDYIKKILAVSTKPVTVKMRLGFDKIEDLESISLSLEKIGVSAIAIHARTGKQLYSGKANYEALKNLGKKIKIPLIISGDIFSLDDAVRALKITSATAVMVARGALGNPFLVTQINNFLENGTKLADSNITDKLLYCKKWMDYFLNKENDKKTIIMIKHIAPYFFTNFNYASSIRSSIVKIKTINDFRNILKFIEKGIKYGKFSK